MNFAPGSVFFGGATFFNAAAPTGAFNGTSMNGTLVQLGQAIGTVGNPAALIHIEEIPLATFGLLLSGMGAVTPAINIKQAVNNVNNPQIIYSDAGGAEIFRLGALDSHNIFVGPFAGINAGVTANGKILIGNSAGHDLTTADIVIAIGSGALQGTGALVQPSNVIAIGNDVLDRNGGTIGDQQLIIGNNSFSGGAALPMGTDNLFIGMRSGSGANSSAIGSGNIILGNRSNPGNINNTTIIASFNNGINLMPLSNVLVLGTNTQNILIGQTVAAWSDNGQRVQITGNVFINGGLAPKIRPSVGLAETFSASDYTILADATAGNFNCNIDPTITAQREGNLKKIDATLNTVTLTALSGNIFGMGAPAPTIVIGVQGQSIHFQSDGVNIYIL